jgi:hypothetical protein
MEPAVKSISFVFLEPKKNIWHNNGGRDYKIPFDLPVAGILPQNGPEQQVQTHEHHHHHHNGKMGEVLKEIIQSETEYVTIFCI